MPRYITAVTEVREASAEVVRTKDRPHVHAQHRCLTDEVSYVSRGPSGELAAQPVRALPHLNGQVLNPQARGRHCLTGHEHGAVLQHRPGFLRSGQTRPAGPFWVLNPAKIARIGHNVDRTEARLSHRDVTLERVFSAI